MGQARGFSVLAERAPSEGPRSTRAVEAPRACPWKSIESKLGGKGSIGVLLLAEHARSEAARSMRAFEDRPGHLPKRETSEFGGERGGAADV